ncbi:hypothetical protein [Rhodococcoides yunnanense]|uniref:hypothetical protein n=1 Tax=Rhodococcoides yunnanense TaxID=278209 RepID=UPI0011150398|nr:hypothetical protein [Rhodococcus yunnanensis]
MISIAHFAPAQGARNSAPSDHGACGVRLWAPICVSIAAGIVIVGLSYRISAHSGSPSAYYGVFWAGMSAAVVPVAIVLVRRSSTDSQRLWAILLLGLSTAVPKFLRNPDVPLYHDEYAHWRQAMDVLVSGRLYHSNSIIPIVEFYPGTSASTVSIAGPSGLSVWSSGQLLVCASHVLTLFAVYVLGRSLLGSGRAGAIAALVYSINPSALYFDTQYAYESVAIGLFLWVLALATLAVSSPDRRVRRGYCAAALLCAAGCTVTHHLTTLVLLAVMALLAMSVTVHTARYPLDSTDMPYAALRWWALLVGIGVIAASWLVFVASPTMAYLAPYVGSSIHQLTGVAASQEESRELLAANVQPLPERIMTALAPAVAGVVFVLGLGLARKERRTLPGALFGFFALAVMYFASVPFVLVPSGAEGARRSWAFTYVAIALIFAFVATSTRWQRSSIRVGRRARAVTVFATLTILAIGNVGGGLNDPYRFPGPFLWGSDTRSASEEARTVAEQLYFQFGSVNVVSDRYTSLALAAYGSHYIAEATDAYPVWNLTQTDSDPDPTLAGDMTFSRYVYLVVDVRMSEAPAFNGDNYGAGDPLAGEPTPQAYLDRLDAVPWAARIMSTEHLRVYRLDLERIGTAVQEGP